MMMHTRNLTPDATPTDEAEAAHTADVSLAREAASGDRRAERRFLMRLLPQVRRTVSYMVPDAEFAADLSQTALLRLLGNAGSFKGESSLEFWASRVTSRVVLSELKKLSRRRKLHLFAPVTHATAKTADEAAWEMLAKKSLSRMLAELSDKQRIAVVLRHVEGHSVEEIASMLECPANTVRERLRVALQKLRRSIAKEPGLKDVILGGCHE